MTVQHIADYHVEHAKEEDGTEVPHRFIFTTRKPVAPMKSELTQEVSKAQEMLEAILGVPGLDFFQPIGRYSLEIVVAKTYDPQAVIAGIIEAIRPVQSEIITPNKTLVT